MQNEIIVILGRKGCGKTVMARYLLRGKARVIVYDPMRQFSDMGAIVESPYDLKEYLIKNGKNPHIRVVYQPFYDPNDKGDIRRREFTNICMAVNCMQSVWFFVDEIDLSLPPRSEDNGFFDNLLARGRHAAISLVATTIRYVDVKRKMTAQADKIICFHMHEGADLDYFEDLWGPVARDLKTLPKYHYLFYDAEQNDVTKHSPIPYMG